MKIAILAPTHRSFISKFLHGYNVDDLPEGYFGAPFIGTLIQGLLDKGHEVVSITTSVTDKKHKRLDYSDGRFTWIVVPARRRTISFNGARPGKILDFYRYERKMMVEALKDIHPDFVHAHWSYEFAGAAKESKLPALITIHDNAIKVFKYMRNPYRLGRLLMSEWVLRNVRFVSTVSPYMQDYVAKRCKNYRIIPNPILIKESAETIKLRIQSKLPTLSKPKILMIMNGWDERKNGLAGLNVYQRLSRRFPGASLHLFGSGTENDGPAHTAALTLGLENIFTNGAVSHDRLIDEIKSSHLLLHPALEESFGLVLIEATSNGVPAIGGKLSGAVPWVLNNADLLADLTTDEDLEAKADNLLADPALYEKTSMKCYLDAQRFAATSVVDRYEAYYKDIIEQWA